MTTAPRISVAIALLNEEQVIPELVRRLGEVLDAIPGGPHEVVFVDDGSSDSTFELIAAAMLALTAPVALAHPERAAHFPDGSVGAVPKYRKTADQILTVCKRDSAKRIRRVFSGRLEKRRLRQLKRCEYRHIQAAVDAARNGAIIRIMPGVYREQPSRRNPEPDPSCANDYEEIGSSLLASGVAGGKMKAKTRLCTSVER